MSDVFTNHGLNTTDMGPAGIQGTGMSRALHDASCYAQQTCNLQYCLYLDEP